NKADQAADGAKDHLAQVESRLGQILHLAAGCCEERVLATTQQTIAAAEGKLLRTVAWTADAARDLACCVTGKIATAEGQLAYQLHCVLFSLEQTAQNTTDKALATARQALCLDLRYACYVADKATDTAKADVAKVHQVLAVALHDAGQAVAKVEGLTSGLLNKADQAADGA